MDGWLRVNVLRPVKMIITFLAVLMVVLVERFFYWRRLRWWGWFVDYQRWLEVRMAALPPWLVWAAVIVLPVLLVSVLQYFVSSHNWRVVQLVVDTGLLFYCMGPDNLWAQSYRILSDLNKQNSSAVNEAQAVFNFKSTMDFNTAEGVQAFHRTFTRAILMAAHQRVFAVVFWFVILGPAGALLYRLIAYVVETSSVPKVHIIKELMDWLPARLFALLFALAGHFTAVLVEWRRRALQGPDGNEKFLADCGILGLDLDNSQGYRSETENAEQQALALIDRTLIIGLIILAMLALVV
jgi:AmpE protein